MQSSLQRVIAPWAVAFPRAPGSSPSLAPRARRCLSSMPDALPFVSAWRTTPNPLARELVIPESMPLLPCEDTVLRFQIPAAPGSMAEVMAASPVVAKLMTIECVSELLLTANRVTVNVQEDALWDSVGPEVANTVMEAVKCGPVSQSALRKLIEIGEAATTSAAAPWEPGSVEEEIVEVLELHIRPYVVRVHTQKSNRDLRLINELRAQTFMRG